MRLLLLSLLSLSLLSCKGSGEQSPAEKTTVPEFALTTTSSIPTPEAIIQTTFVPNNVATWASAIIMRGESGSLWRTTTEEYPPALISKGPYSDVYGLARDNAAGMFLALADDGGLKAYVEIDDEGNYDKAAVSYGGPAITKFCAGNPYAGTWAMAEDGQLHKLTVNFSTANVVEISAGEKTTGPKNITGCASGPKGDLYAKSETKKTPKWSVLAGEKWKTQPGFTNMVSLTFLAPDTAIGKSQLSTSHFISDGKTMLPVAIEGGLSIYGVAASYDMHATPLPMGSAYNEGLITIADKDENRLVLISGAYVLHQLQETDPKEP